MTDGPINSPTRGRSASEFRHAREEETDQQLVARFVARRDEAAFAALVKRHGPMVLAACRRVLCDVHEAEDACQATFLVLARKAGSLRRPELLANWLYGVAFRAARKAQRQAAQYRAHAATRGSAMLAIDSTAEVVWQDLRPVLDGELQRLPGKYRTAVVLCYLEGLSAEEVAQRLGCPRGTILSRLARGRERLRSRLTRRGLALSAGLLAVLLAQCSSASTPLVTAFIHSTAKAACSFAAGRRTAAGLVPGRSAELARAVLHGMLLAKLTGAAVCLLGVGLSLSGVAWGLRPGRAADHPTPEVVVGEDLPPDEEPAPDGDRALLQGTWRGVTMEWQGQKLDARATTFTFVGDDLKIDCRMLDPPWTPTYGCRLDSQARPKKIDMTAKNPKASLIGVYELNGDTLKINHVTLEDAAGKRNERPTGFVVKGDQFVWVLKREPAGKGNELPKKP
jgi:RNA polymerase sigma factor (sigma-70 family)